MNISTKILILGGTAIAAAAVGFYAGYQQAADYHQALELQAQNEALLKERNLNAQYQQALNDARARQSAILDDFERANNELDSLRHTVQNSLPRDTNAACTRALSARGALLTDCAAKYIGMATKADQHAEDARTLMNAWQALEKGN